MFGLSVGTFQDVRNKRWVLVVRSKSIYPKLRLGPVRQQKPRVHGFEGTVSTVSGRFRQCDVPPASHGFGVFVCGSVHIRTLAEGLPVVKKYKHDVPIACCWYSVCPEVVAFFMELMYLLNGSHAKVFLASFCCF